MVTIQLTTGPRLGELVLYDFNPSPTQYTGHEDLSWGNPSWLGQPGSSGAVDDYRTVSFKHYMAGGLPGAVAELSRLARPLVQREDCWLLVQLTPSAAPRWFHVWRSNLPDLSIENLIVRNNMPDGMHGITITLQADPYLWGEQETLLDGVTVTNNLIDPTSPSFLALPDVIGDAAAPLSLVGDWGSIYTSHSENKVAVASVHPEVGYPEPLAYTVASSFTVVAGAVNAGTDATAMGGKCATIGSAPPPGWLTVLDGVSTTGGHSSPIASPGRYRMLLRTLVTGSPDTLQFRGGQTLGSNTYDSGSPLNTIFNDPVSPPGLNGWVDLGEVAVPVGTGTAIPAGATLPTPPSLCVQMEATGTGFSIRIEAVVLIPIELVDADIDADILTSTWTGPGSKGAMTWDADEEMWRPDPTNPGFAPALAGGFPQVVPGAVNVLHWLGMRAYAGGAPGLAPTDALAAESTVTATYFPRYIWPSA